MGPGGVVWGKNRVQKSRETVPLRVPTGTGPSFVLYHQQLFQFSYSLACYDAFHNSLF